MNVVQDAESQEDIPKPAEEVPCVVCDTSARRLVCSSTEIKAQHAYLLQFHKKRLRSIAAGLVPKSALADRVAFSQNYPTDVVSCLTCGLVFRNPRPTKKSVSDTYAEDQYGEDRLKGLFDAQFKIFRAKMNVLAKWLPSSAAPRIVEVGSFVGGFLAAGKEKGWSMLGVDPGREVSDFCATRGLRVHRGTLDDAAILPASVDCVAIWNTFDQLPDPHPTLAAARRILRPGGLLVVRGPNGACFRLAVDLTRRLRQPMNRWLQAAMAWNNLLTFPYLYGYSVRPLDRLLGRYGLQRVATRPDTLVQLADAQTKTWAVWEERLLKWMCRLVFRGESLSSPGTLITAPWVDVYYRFSQERLNFS